MYTMDRQIYELGRKARCDYCSREACKQYYQALEAKIAWMQQEEFAASATIDRLRAVLRHYVSECDCNGGTYHEEDHITGKTLVKDCPKCEPARTALGEKE